jgi:hypothetical protein
MSDFAVKNPMDNEDDSPRPGVGARFPRKYLDSMYLGVSYFRYALELIAVTSDQPESGGGELVADRWPEQSDSPVLGRPRRAAPACVAGRVRVR